MTARTLFQFRVVATAVCLGWFLLSTSARGVAQVVVQQPRESAPVVLHLEPPVVQAGQSTNVVFVGEHLVGASQLLVQADFVLAGSSAIAPPSNQHPASTGLEIEQVVEVAENRATLRISVPAETPPGPYMVHLLCDSGLSNPRILWIEPAQTNPVTSEAEPNDEVVEASTFSVPGVVTGMLQPTEFDYFRFQVDQALLDQYASQDWIIEVIAARLGSPLRPVITLFDSSGRELASGQVPSHGIEPDMRLSYRIAAPGEYVVRIAERTYRGNEHATYALRVAPGAYADTIFPLGGSRVTSTRVELSGGTLGEPITFAVDPGMEHYANCLRASTPPFVSTPLAALIRSDEPDALTQIVASPAGFAFQPGNSNIPEIFEQEPNDMADSATPLQLPSVTNGRIDRALDVDRFRFSAKSGDRIRFELTAAALGSPLDGVLVIRNAKGRIVASADDRSADDENPPIVRPVTAPRVHPDPLLDFSAPADGDFVLAVEDRFGFGGARYAYRLTAAEPTDSVALLVQPAPSQVGDQREALQTFQPFFGQAGSGAVSLDRGGRAALVVQAVRRGYNGAIALSVENLPQGVTASPAQIAPGQNQATILLSADFDAPSAAGFARVSGTIKLGEEEQIVPAIHPTFLSALPGSAPVKRTMSNVAVGVSGQAAELAILLDPRLTVAPGERGQIKAKVYRREGLEGEVVIQADVEREGIDIPRITIPADQAEAVIPVSLAAEAKAGTRSIAFHATMKTEDAERPFEATATTNIRIVPLVTVELLTPQMDVPVGETAELKLRITRNVPGEIPLRLSVTGLPAGLSIREEALTIAGDQSGEFSLPIVAGENARPSSIRRFVRIQPQAESAGRDLSFPTLRCALRITDPNSPSP